MNRLKEKLIQWLFLSCALVTVFTTIAIVGFLSFETFHFFSEVSIIEFFTDPEWTPLFIDKHFGILPLLSGTFLITVIAIMFAVPMGTLIALYLSEYASGTLRRILKPLLEVLAGVPTVVYGYFTLLFVTPLLQKIIPSLEGFNALAPGLVLGIMILPMIASLSEDAIYSVPQSIKNAGYALGSSKLQVSFFVTLPAAFSGIIAAIVLGVSRAIGETMLVTIAAGQMANLSLNPLKAVETMTAFIVQVSLGDTPAGTIEYQTIFAVGMTLFIITFCLNIFSHKLKKSVIR
jgi:phosphate transport system permease protein